MAFLEDKALNPGIKEQADPASLDAFIAWLETKPSEEEYVWVDPLRCAMGQYRSFVRSRGGFRGVTFLENIIGENAYMAITRAKPYTFGAALDRALAFKQTAAA